jgi:hypothetical protein
VAQRGASTAIYLRHNMEHKRAHELNTQRKCRFAQKQRCWCRGGESRVHVAVAGQGKASVDAIGGGIGGTAAPLPS